MKIKFSTKERNYWASTCVACSQVTFGIGWASIFLPLDVYKVLVIALNLSLTVLFVLIGWFLNRK